MNAGCPEVLHCLMAGSSPAGGIQFRYWLWLVSRGRTAGWRLRERKWIRCCRIRRQLYIINCEVFSFWERARRGEFGTAELPVTAPQAHTALLGRDRQSQAAQRPALVVNAFLAAKTASAGGMEYQSWLSLLGTGRTTGWEWQKRGWLRCYRVGKQLFIANDEISLFWQRATRGEFEQAPTVPQPHGQISHS